METKTITNEINQILEDIYELIKTDERTKDDFNEYLKTMGVYGLADDKIKEYYTPYIFERAIPNLEVNPIMLYNDSKSSELSKAMEKSFKSIFGFSCTNLDIQSPDANESSNFVCIVFIKFIALC